MKYYFINITSLRVVQKKYCGPLFKHSLWEPDKGPTAVCCADGILSEPSVQFGRQAGPEEDRRHRCSFADGGRRHNSDPRHKITGAVGTTATVGTCTARRAQKIAPLTVSTCADGQAVGTGTFYFCIFANLFISCKYLNLFIYVLLSSIYTNCRDSYSKKLCKCYCMRVHIISEGGNAPITCLCPHVVYTKCYWIEI
jgi:hypothetical protein